MSEGEIGEEGYTNASPFCSDGPRLDEFLAEMRREVFEGREGYMNVGEAPGITPERNEFITNPAHKELDMLFLFDHVGIDQEGSKWNTVPFEVKNLRDRMSRAAGGREERRLGQPVLLQPRPAARRLPLGQRL